MNKRLNVSVIQMPAGSTRDNLHHLKQSVDALMTGYIRPELVVGVEFGISPDPEPLAGLVTAFLSALARKHHIYLIPGTMAEKAPELPDGSFYNTCPVFGPDGQCITAYRKRTPFWPEEPSMPGPDEGCCLFRIPEKDITVGLLICYEQFFPEIPRALALAGAELMICPAMDSAEFSHIPDIIPRTRALENEVFYIWTNSAGPGAHGTCCGKSIFVDPEGRVIHQCGAQPELITQTLNIGSVPEKRILGADQHLAALKRFSVRYPYGGDPSGAPVYQILQPITETPLQYEERLRNLGRQTFSGTADAATVSEAESCMQKLLGKM